MQTGICTNIGNCTKADSGEKIQLPVGALFVCPECGRELSRVGGSERTGRSPLLPLLIALVVLGGLIFGAWMFFRKPTDDHIVTPPPPPGTQAILRLSGSNTIGSKLGPAL